jgi:hypothetical protein
MSRASGPLHTGGVGFYPERPSRKRIPKMLRNRFAIGLDVFFGWILFFVSCGGQGGGNASVRPAQNITTIQHTVFIIKENHTFDNYFGTFSGADGGTSGITSTQFR